MSEAVSKKSQMLGLQDVRVRRNVRDLSFIYLSVIAALAILAVAFAFLWSRLMVVNIGYEISKANTMRSELIEKNKRLRIEFMKLKSPERIERIASGELQLVRPTGEQVINIR